MSVRDINAEVAVAFTAAETEPFDTGTEEKFGAAETEESVFSKHGFPEPIEFDPDQEPVLPDELISGVLFKGDSMVVSGQSKVGKTMVLLGLTVAIAIGGEWLGLKCAKGRVLYIDGELHIEVVKKRLRDILERVDTGDGSTIEAVKGMITFWPMRGYAEGLEALKDVMLEGFGEGGYTAIILDPAYIFMDGDENSAEATRAFVRALGEMARGLGCTLIYSHHHSKGLQGGKSSIDRMSGSGVHARYADAILDLIDLSISEEKRDEIGLLEGDVPLRIEITARNFKKPDPFNVVYRYPVHLLDTNGELSELKPTSPEVEGGKIAGAAKAAEEDSRWRTAEQSILRQFRNSGVDRIKTSEAMELVGYSTRKSFRDRVNKSELLKMYNPSGNESYVVLIDFLESEAPPYGISSEEDEETGESEEASAADDDEQTQEPLEF